MSRENVKIFSHDRNRGTFSMKLDFMVANVAALFRETNILTFFALSKQYGILEFWTAYLILMPLISFPILFFQSYIGQFTSTGFISIFRMAPCMKGLSYVMLVLNTKFVILESVMCVTFTASTFHGRHTPSLLTSLGWIFFLWAFIAAILLLGVKRITKLLYFSLGIPVLLLVCYFIVFGFTPGFKNIYNEISQSSMMSFINWQMWASAAAMCIWTFGNTNGVFITLGSYNRFYDSPVRNSIIVLVATTFLNLMAMVVCFGAKKYFYNYGIEGFGRPPYLNTAVYYTRDVIMLYKIITAVGVLCLFFNEVVLNVLSNITSLCDEHRVLRKFRIQFILGFCFFHFLCTVPYFINENVWLAIFTSFALPGKAVIVHFLFILSVLWLYGERRFRHDYKFMTQKVFPGSLFKTLQFSAPLVLTITTIMYLCWDIETGFLYKKFTDSTTIYILQIIFCAVPFVIIPFYSIGLALVKRSQRRKILQENSNLWYPAPPVSRDTYETSFNLFIGENVEDELREIR